MLRILKHLWLGAALIAATAAVLLLSDLNHRQKKTAPAASRLPRIAVMQFAATALLDETVAGVLEGLREGGYEDGRTARIQRFNASGDYATANTMARDIVASGFDVIITAATPALQVMAAANRDGKTIHVFCAVTDPYGSGVGITGPEPGQHPPHLVGIGTFQPVAHTFAIARQMSPGLKRVGVVWNPTEHNSEACVLKARAACRELGIELIEVNAGSTSEVSEAVRSLLARDVEAIWIGGDTVAISGITTMVSAGRVAHVPVFTNDPANVTRGALFSLGATYGEVGRRAAELAVRILRGTDPRTLRVDNVVPERLSLNESLLPEFKSAWIFPDDVRGLAARMAPVAQAAPVRRPIPGRMYKVGIIYFCPHPFFDQAIAGIREGLAESGFVEGRNLSLKLANPNGDMSILPQVVTNLEATDIDLLIPLSTPCLAGVCANVRGRPIVFTAVTEPCGAGAGRDFTHHLPNITGAVWPAPQPALFSWLKRLYPDCRKVGVIYNASEANSRTEMARAREMLAARGMIFEERTLASSSEITEALSSVLAARVDAVFGLSDNTVANAFASIAAACRRERIPLLADDNSDMGTGALFSCGPSPHANGVDGGRIAARVLLGEPPGGIPFAPTTRTETAVDLAAAAQLGIVLPSELLCEADIFHHVRARLGRPASVALVDLGDNAVMSSAEAGLSRGLRESGLVEGEDFVIRRFSAQGELSQLPQIVDTALASQPDLIITASTPALIAAARKVTAVPLVFTVASDPEKLGLFARGRPANLTGVHDDPPVDKLLDMARRNLPGLAVVGTLYDPAQPNSLISVEKLRAACRQQGIALIEVTAAGVSDVAPAAQALVQRGARAVLVSADNLVDTAFPAIVQATRPANVPVFSTEPKLIELGATGAIGDDFEAWGAQSGRLVAKVLAGVSPADLPIQATAVQRTVEPAAPAVPAPVVAAPPATPVPAATLPWNLQIVAYSKTEVCEDCLRGLKDGLARSGLVEGRDFALREFNAHGDMATLSSIMTAVQADQPDLLIAITTPALQAAVRKVGSTRIVFTCIADAVRAGAGRSETDHMPNVTGIATRSAFEGMARVLREVMPRARRVGTLFSPAEINSVSYRDWLAAALKSEGIELVAVPVTASSETADATIMLCHEQIDAVCQISDNTVLPGFGQIVRKAGVAGLPVFCFDSNQLKTGAVLALARDFYQAGVEAGELCVRVLRGADPARIPFTNVRSERLIVNPAAAARLGLALPAGLLQRAETFTAETLRIVAYNETDMAEDCTRGLKDGLARGGLVEGRDFTLRVLNAQGDMSTLSSIMASVRADQPDLLMTITTPSLQAALRQAGGTRIVFTGVGDGVQAGAGKTTSDHLPNVTGITTRSSFDGMARLLREVMPRARRAGTLFTPAEINSVLYKNWLAEALKKEGVELVAVPVTASAETAEATTALCNQDIDAVCQIVDNTTRPGFAQIVRKAAGAHLPVFCFEASQMKDGAVLALSRDYYQASLEAGEIGVRVLRGVSPATIPFANTRSERLVVNPEAAARFGLTIPDDVLGRAEIFKAGKLESPKNKP